MLVGKIIQWKSKAIGLNKMKNVNFRMFSSSNSKVSINEETYN